MNYDQRPAVNGLPARARGLGNVNDLVGAIGGKGGHAATRASGLTLSISSIETGSR